MRMRLKLPSAPRKVGSPCYCNSRIKRECFKHVNLIHAIDTDDTNGLSPSPIYEMQIPVPTVRSCLP